MTETTEQQRLEAQRNAELNGQQLREFWQQRDQPRGRWDVELPEWAQQRTNYLRLCLAVLLGVLALGNLLGCSAKASDWGEADAVLPDAFLQQVIDDNTADLSETDRQALVQDTKAFELAPDLVAVYFRSPLLTGRLGSLLTVYRLSEKSPTPLLQTYLTDDLPANGDFALIEAIDRELNDLPCLQVHQVNRPQPEVTRYTLCYDGVGAYVVEEAITIPFDDSDE